MDVMVANIVLIQMDVIICAGPRVLCASHDISRVAIEAKMPSLTLLRMTGSVEIRRSIWELLEPCTLGGWNAEGLSDASGKGRRLASTMSVLPTDDEEVARRRGGLEGAGVTLANLLEG